MTDTQVFILCFAGLGRMGALLAQADGNLGKRPRSLGTQDLSFEGNMTQSRPKTLRVAVAVAIASGLVLTMASRSEATTISVGSGVTFYSPWSPTGGTGIANATGVNIDDDKALVACAADSNCGGDYAPLNGSLIQATYNDFQFNPLGPPPVPVALWSFMHGGLTYSFHLATVNIVSQAADGLVLTGTGTLKITGFSDTTAKWSFSGDTSGAQIVFSSTNSAAVVPDGGSTMAFLGLGLLIVGTLSRKLLA